MRAIPLAAPSGATLDLFEASSATRTIDLVLDPWGAALLLVSDRPVSARRLEEALSGGDELFHVTTVGNLSEAMSALDGQDFSAVVVDDALPEAQGPDGLVELRTRAPQLPLVTLNARAASEVVSARQDVARRIRAAQPSDAPDPEASLDTDDVTDLVRVVSARGAPQGLALAYVPLMRGVASAVGVRCCVRWAPHGRHASEIDFRRRVRRVDRQHVLWRWALEAACAEVHALDAVGLTAHVVALPVEPEALADREVRRTLRHVLRDNGVAPERLLLEVTEEAVLRDPDGAERVVHELRLMDVGVSLVEVGRGFSRLATLADLPVSVIELDERLVADVMTPRSRRGVAGLLAFAEAVDARAGAAGVETEHQARVLRDLGCQQMRGPLWGPGRDAARMVRWLSREA